MAKFRIFYSWQSDLSKSKTTIFIRECIEQAIVLAADAETIEAERDEATKGLTGAPDIVQSIYSKIDESDLFIADVSFCYTRNETDADAKYSPNPNVLIELGYAAKVLGWERIICLCNTEFGRIDDLPFDIAHNRTTGYSLNNGKSRNENKLELSQIIFTNIRDLRNGAPRVKAGFAHHIVGGYDEEQRQVIERLSKLEVVNAYYTEQSDKIREEALNLVNDISTLTEKIEQTRNVEKELQTAVEKTELPQTLKKLSAATDSIILQNNRVLIDTYMANQQVTIDESDRKSTRERAKEFLGIEIRENFFDLGNLSTTKTFHMFQSEQLDGTEDERAKYEKYNELAYKLDTLWMRKEYPHTFDGLVFVPIAIQNISKVADDDITVVLEVEQGQAVIPDKDLIFDQLTGLQGTICEEGLIEEMFFLPEDGTIHIAFEPYDYSDIKMPTPVLPGFFDKGKSDEDYEDELEKYIMTPAASGAYEFDVSSLRPSECKWLSRGLLLRPEDRCIKLNYHIHSTKSSGDLSGVLSWTE